MSKITIHSKYFYLFIGFKIHLFNFFHQEIIFSLTCNYRMVSFSETQVAFFMIVLRCCGIDNSTRQHRTRKHIENSGFDYSHIFSNSNQYWRVQVKRKKRIQHLRILEQIRDATMMVCHQYTALVIKPVIVSHAISSVNQILHGFHSFSHVFS